jgi:cyclophilin family peptidyl-prolyl cis-trans isomerase
MSQRAYLTLASGTQKLGTLRLLVASNVVPRTAENFLTLLQRTKDDGEGGYLDSTFHRIIRGFMAQGGDFDRGDGTGGRSIYGPSFADENFVLGHDSRGVLAMANSGPDTNGSQFYITFRPTPHLDGRHVVFGRVDLGDSESSAVLDALERVSTGREDRPKMVVKIIDCGVEGSSNTAATTANQVAVAAEELKVSATSSTAKDSDEIELDDDDDDDDDDDEDDNEEDESGLKLQQQQAPAAAAKKDSDEIELDDDEGEEHGGVEEQDKAAPPPRKGSKAALQARLRKLKMKMNQSRQLNKREVQSEGERMGSEEGAAQYRRQQNKRDRGNRKKEWEAMSGRAAESAARAAASVGGAGAVDDADVKKLTDQASDVLRKAQRKADRAATNRYEITDTYNSEGQQRHYERSLKSVPRGMTQAHAAAASGLESGAVYDPLLSQLDADSHEVAASSERAGARRLAAEMHRRAAKSDASRKKRSAVEFDSTDISGINKRNKRFNEKIGRNFDAHTAEIRQNLERGTAL